MQDFFRGFDGFGIVRQLHLQDLSVTGNDGQQIIEIVRDSSGQFAEALEFVLNLELLFELTLLAVLLILLDENGNVQGQLFE